MAMAYFFNRPLAFEEVRILRGLRQFCTGPTPFQVILRAHRIIVYEFRIFYEHNVTVSERATKGQWHRATLSTSLINMQSLPSMTRT